MTDGALSEACEFSVCDLDFETSVESITLGEPWEIEFWSDNMNVIIAYLYSEANEYGHRTVFVTEEDRRNGRVAIPADLLGDPGQWQVWLIGEGRYGRLKRRRDIAAIDPAG